MSSPDVVHIVKARDAEPSENWPAVPGRFKLGNPHDIWRAARAMGQYPELEWTFPILGARHWALSGAMPAIFYEKLTDFDQTRWAVWLSYELTHRRNELGPFVEAGFEYFPQTYRTATGRLEMPGAAEPSMAGRHVVSLVGFKDDCLLFQNSWGPEWGDRGFGYISPEYFDAYVTTVDVRWSSATGPSTAMNSCLGKLKDPDRSNSDFVDCWKSRNDFGIDELLVDGVRHLLISWEVISLESRRPVYVFEWRNSSVVLGRAHVYAPNDPGGAFTLREFFIGPRRRRKGHGSFLEEAVSDYVLDLGGETIDLWMHKPDTLPRCGLAAEGFAGVRGYAPTGLVPPRGDIAAIWRKELR